MGWRDEGPLRQVGLRQKALVLFSVLALIALVVGSIFGDKGVLQVWEQRERTAELERQVDALRLENARLAEEIRALRSDARTLERLAREQLGLARPGETVFLLTDMSQASEP